MNQKNQSKKRNVRRQISGLLLCTLLLIMLSGCKVVESISEYNLPKGSRLGEKKETKEAVLPSEFEKTEISLLASTFKSLNPYAPQDKSMESILKQCYQGLMTMSAGGEMVGQLADEIVMNEDATSCLVTLGEKQFHDGTPVGFRDINYSWQKAQVGRYAEQAAVIRKISTQADGKIKIDFHAAGILNLYSLSFPIVPEASLEKGDAFAIRGTGAYRLAEYKPMQTLILESDFNRLEVNLTRSEKIGEEAFLNGLTDIYFTEEFPWFAFSEETLRNIAKFPGHSFYFMGFQLKKGVLADVTVRKYLTGKLDLSFLDKQAFLNHLLPQKLPFLRGKEWEEVQKTEVNGREGLDILDKNPIPALQKLRLIYPLEDKSLALLAEGIEKEWEAYVGIERLGLTEQEYLAALSAGDFDIYLTKAEVGEYPNLRDFFGSGGKYNYSEISGLDVAVNAFAVAKNKEELMNAYLRLIREIENAALLVPFGFLENAVILSDQVEGNLMSKTYDILSGITEIRVAQKNKK